MTSTLSKLRTIMTWYEEKTHTFITYMVANTVYYWLILDWIVENKDLLATRRIFVGLSNNCLVRIIANTS